MTSIAVSIYKYHTMPENDFACMTTIVGDPYYVIYSDMTLVNGERTLQELSEKFDVPIITRDYEDFVVSEVVVHLP